MMDAINVAPLAPRYAERTMMNFSEQLRFIQRVLEGNPPQSDKDEAARMVREMRRQVLGGRSRVDRVLQLMQENPARELYEGGDSSGGACGEFWVCYTAGVAYEPLSAPEVQELADRGLIRQKYPGCYVLQRTN